MCYCFIISYCIKLNAFLLLFTKYIYPFCKKTNMDIFVYLDVHIIFRHTYFFKIIRIRKIFCIEIQFVPSYEILDRVCLLTSVLVEMFPL